MLVRAICCDPHALFRRKVPKVGVEPTRPCGHWILSPARLPFRHFGIFSQQFEGLKFTDDLPQSASPPTGNSLKISRTYTNSLQNSSDHTLEIVGLRTMDIHRMIGRSPPNL